MPKSGKYEYTSKGSPKRTKKHPSDSQSPIKDQKSREGKRETRASENAEVYTLRIVGGQPDSSNLSIITLVSEDNDILERFEYLYQLLSEDFVSTAVVNQNLMGLILEDPKGPGFLMKEITLGDLTSRVFKRVNRRIPKHSIDGREGQFDTWKTVRDNFAEALEKSFPSEEISRETTTVTATYTVLERGSVIFWKNSPCSNPRTSLILSTFQA